jgi:hypothetical protein
VNFYSKAKVLREVFDILYGTVLKVDDKTKSEKKFLSGDGFSCVDFSSRV